MRAPPFPLLLCVGLLLAPLVVRAQPAAATPLAELSVASLQLPAQADPAWEHRREAIAQLLATLQPDVITVQQVLQEGRRNPACWLASRLRYSCDFITADPPSQAQRHGSAMLSRLRVEEDGVTLLHPPGRYSAAGMMRVAVGEGQVNIYVARLRPEPDTTASRQHQANDLLAWIAATSDGHPSLVAGDFAASSSDVVRGMPGFQPARRNPSARVEKPGAGNGNIDSHGLDVLFQVKSFSGKRQQRIELPTDGDMPVLPLGVMAVLRLQAPAG
jgi:endonuclease/exonuclease/phosphatase family metal-dependent hydrolase